MAGDNEEIVVPEGLVLYRTGKKKSYSPVYVVECKICKATDQLSVKNGKLSFQARILRMSMRHKHCINNQPQKERIHEQETL